VSSIPILPVTRSPEQGQNRRRRIDQRAGRGLREDAGDGRDRHDHADAGLVPLLLGQEVDREIRPEPVANIGEEEVRRVERAIFLEAT
jgi:hypothetical protein